MSESQDLPKRVSNAEYMREWRKKNPHKTKEDQVRAKIRNQALSAMARENPTLFEKYYTRAVNAHLTKES